MELALLDIAPPFKITLTKTVLLHTKSFPISKEQVWFFRGEGKNTLEKKLLLMITW